MKIKTIRVSRQGTIFFQQDFNRISEPSTPAITLTADLEDGDNLEEAIKELQIEAETAIAKHIEMIKELHEVKERVNAKPIEVRKPQPVTYPALPLQTTNTSDPLQATYLNLNQLQQSTDPRQQSLAQRLGEKFGLK